jgi:hypothetical protein
MPAIVSDGWLLFVASFLHVLMLQVHGTVADMECLVTEVPDFSFYGSFCESHAKGGVIIAIRSAYLPARPIPQDTMIDRGRCIMVKVEAPVRMANPRPEPSIQTLAPSARFKRSLLKFASKTKNSSERSLRKPAPNVRSKTLGPNPNPSFPPPPLRGRLLSEPAATVETLPPQNRGAGPQESGREKVLRCVAQ